MVPTPGFLVLTSLIYWPILAKTRPGSDGLANPSDRCFGRTVGRYASIRVKLHCSVHAKIIFGGYFTAMASRFAVETERHALSALLLCLRAQKMTTAEIAKAQRDLVDDIMMDQHEVFRVTKVHWDAKKIIDMHQAAYTFMGLPSSEEEWDVEMFEWAKSQISIYKVRWGHRGHLLLNLQ